MQQIRNHHLDRKLIGTLFEEEEIGKKDNYHNQVARDEKGRKHWHGAFTGGFDAGYKNTCGSRDGWAPQKFLSSRTNRVQPKEQTVEAFLDEEDVGQQRIGVNLTVRPEFDSFGTSEIQVMQETMGVNKVIGMAPEELVFNENRSIGFRVLQDLRKGRLRKQQVNSVSVGPVDEKIEDVPTQWIPIKSNDTYVGVGYKGTVDRFNETTSVVEQQFLVFVRKFFQESTEMDELEKKRDNRIMFSGGDNENQEECKYIIVLITSLDFYEIGDVVDDKKKKVKQEAITDHNTTLQDLFQKQQTIKRSSTKIERIDVPNDYDPYHRVKNLIKSGTDMSKIVLSQKGSTAQQRRLLEDDKPIEDATSIRKDLDRKQFVRGSNEQTATLQGVKTIYPTDKYKQMRFEHFCWQKEGKMVGGIPPTNNLTKEQQEEEESEFQRMYQMFQTEQKHVSEPVFKMPVAQPTVIDPMAAFRSKRSGRKWAPLPLVCLRLGLICPYTDEEIRMINKSFKKKKDDEEEEVPKDKFTAGGVYREWEDGKNDKRNQQVFDPSQLGLPLSFKSMSMQRNQQQMQYEQNKEMSKQVLEQRQPQNRMKDKEEEVPIPASERRMQDISLFDAIFGDD